MVDKRGNTNLGDQILNAVDNILTSGNFDKLNSVVSDTVSKALEETRKQLEQITSGQVLGQHTGTQRTSSTREAGSERTAADKNLRNAAGQYSGIASTKTQTTSLAYNKPVKVPKNKVKKVGGASSVLLRVFGGIGTGIFGFLFLIAVVTEVGSDVYWNMVIFFGTVLAACIAMINVGARKSARLKRAQRYIQVMQGKTYININDLALLTHESPAYVRRDVKKMIQKGIFPEGHLDMGEQCLIIGDVAYREYLRLEKSRIALKAEEEQKRIAVQNSSKVNEQELAKEAEKTIRAAKEEDEYRSRDGGHKSARNEVSQSENPELDAMIQEGRDYIKQLRDLNDAIEGEVISGKLFYLENILKEIFEQLKEHPEQMPQMHKFMEYYLPTTLKLVTAYEEFDRVSVPGQDILSAKCEIEKTLDTINAAFGELLNKLFRNRAFDVTTDAQVLQTMLEREGLTKQAVFATKPAMNADKPEKMLQ